jgi:topoisomerase-4 subunit A
LKRVVIKEIEADAKAHGDERRTLIQAEKKAVAEVKVVDEPVTVVVSAKGWVRARTGHGHDPAGFAFKAGDGLYGTFECRTVDALIVFGSNGRVYSVAVSSLPGARGDGAPITTMIDLEAGTRVVHYLAGPADLPLLLAHTGATGLLAKLGDLVARNKAGKAFLSLEEGEEPLPPVRIGAAHRQVACAVAGGRLLVFGLDELKQQPGGGRGLMLMDLEDGEKLAAVTTLDQALRVTGIGRGAKAREDDLRLSALAFHVGKRGRKGKPLPVQIKVDRLLPLD